MMTRTTLTRPSGFREFNCPDSFEIDEICVYFDFGKSVSQTIGGALQFLFVMARFGGGIITERLQSAVSSAIGMELQNHQLGLMKADRFADLLENELAIGFLLGRGEAFRAAGNFYGIRVKDTDAL